MEELKNQFKGESEDLLREAAYNLALGGIDTSGLHIKARQALETLKRKDQISIRQGFKTEANGLEICPICKFEMKSVKLLDDKPAWYCPDHRIVVPKPVE